MDGDASHRVIVSSIAVEQRNRPCPLYPIGYCHQALSRKCQYLNTNLALEKNRLYDRRGAVWGGRYKAILVSNEEAAQAGRLRYLLAHGVKEGLVAHAREWPGVHSVREILAGEPIRGLWFDRTQEYAARNRSEDFSRLDYASEESFEMPPCRAGLTFLTTPIGSRSPRWWNRSRARRQPSSSRAAARRLESRSSCGRVRRLVRSGARNLLPLCTMRRRGPCVSSSEKRTAFSCRPFEMRPSD